MKKHSLIFLSLIMLLVCLNSYVIAQEKTSSTKNVTNNQATKKTQKKKTSTNSKKKVAKKVGITQETVQQDNLKTKICSDSLVSRAKSYLGTHYQYASCVPSSGFDCSGFVYHVFSTFDTKVPRSSIDYGSLHGSIPSDSAQIGDVIVFTGTNAKIKHARSNTTDIWGR